MQTDWTEEYWKFMISENIEEAIDLKNQNFPESFFKYKSLHEKALQSIEEDYVWLAEITSLNDPFECSIQFDNNECLRHFFASEKFQTYFALLTGKQFSKEDIHMLSTSEKPYQDYIRICSDKQVYIKVNPERQLQTVQSRWADIVEETNKNLRICSFSLDSGSLLLWSHYANEHKGICIEYDFVDTGAIRAFMQPVIYRNRVHKIGLFEELTTFQMIGASLIKSEDWSYEQEWRLTIFKQKSDFLQKMLSPVPKAIYLGTRFNANEDDLKNKLIEIATRKGIPLFQMKKHPGEFRLIT